MIASDTSTVGCGRRRGVRLPSSQHGRRRLLACLLIFGGWLPRAAADERPTMSDTSTETEVRACVLRAVRAVGEEQLAAYLDCFTSKQRARIRRPAALLFVAHSLDIDLIDSHLLSDENGTAELAVNYMVTITDRSYTVISVLAFASVDGRWQISGERVLANIPAQDDAAQSGSSPVFRFGGGCADGRCGL